MKQDRSMRCLFIYDSRLKTNNNRFYTAGGINDDIFKRYATNSDKIIVITRMEHIEEANQYSEILSKNLEFNPIKGLSFIKAFSIHSVSNMKLFVNEIRQADFIVTRLPSFLGIFALMLNTGFKKKYFLEVAGDAEEALLTSRVNPSKAFKACTRLFTSLNKYFIKHADGVIYVTQYALQNKYPTDGLSSYASNVEINVRVREFNIQDYECLNSNYKIGLIGDYNNHYKGLAEAFHAIARLKALGYQGTLQIVGSGTLINYYKMLAKELNIGEAIYFKGRLKNTLEVIDWLETLDLYIQPSYTEGLPRALIEAMSVGLPAVATNVGGIPELLEKDDVVPANDSSALANRIKDFLDSVELRHQRGNLNFDKAKFYDREVLSKRRSAFWSKCRDLVRKQK